MGRVRDALGRFVKFRGWGTKRKEQREAGPAPVPEVPPAAGYDPETIATAVLLVLSNSATPRIVEEVSTRGTTLLRKTIIDFVVPREVRPGAGRLVVPISAAARGVLWDTEEASCDGRPISTLVHSENALLAQAVLGVLWRRAFPAGEPDPRLKTRVLSLPLLSSQGAADTIAGVSGELERLAKALDPKRSHLVEDLRRAAKFFAGNYIVFAELPQDVRGRIVVTRLVSAPYIVRAQGPLRRWRRSAGLRPVTLTIPLYGAPFRAMSYHLRVRAPEGYHTHFRQLIGDVGGSTAWAPVPVGVHDIGSVEWSPPGGDHAHLYIAHTPAAPVRPSPRRALVAEVKFAEDLPGSLVGTFASAAILAILAALSWAYFDRVFAAGAGSPEQTAVDQANSSFAAVLLAIPGIASLWFRPRRVDELVRLPLTALVAPVVTGLLSFLIGLVFVGYRLSPCEPLRAMPEVDPCGRRTRWVALCLLSIVWAAFLGIRVLSKHSSEPCRPPWSVRVGRLLTAVGRVVTRTSPPAKTNPLPWRPPGWVRWLWTGRVPELRPLPVQPTLDDVYDGLVPPSRRGDVYLRRAESFEYPFITDDSAAISHSTVDACVREMLAARQLEAAAASSRRPRGT